MSQIGIEFTGEDAKLQRAFIAQEKKIVDLQHKLKELGATGRKAGDDMAGSMDNAGRKSKDAFDVSKVMKFTAGLVGVGSVSAAIGMVNQGYETWIKNMREISEGTTKLAKDYTAFAILQQGGTKAARVSEVGRMSAKYGASLGEGYDVFQSVQSAIAAANPRLTEDQVYAAAKRSFDTILAGNQVGIDIATGAELEGYGISQGRGGGDFERMAYVAGKASARNPQVIGTAGQSLRFWDDKELGFAAAAVLSGSVSADELKTYTKAGGRALSMESGLAKTFTGLGVGEGATRMQRLEALAKAGIDTPEELSQWGLNEVIQQGAVSTLVQNVKSLKAIEAQIEAEARPGLFASDRKAAESEVEQLSYSRQIDEATARLEYETALGPYSIEAQKAELLARRRAVAARRLGFEQWGGMDFIEDGRMDPYDAFQVRIADFMAGSPTTNPNDTRMGLIDAEVARMEQEEKLRNSADDLTAKLDEAGRAAERFTKSMGGGPTYGGPTEDK